MTEHIIPFPVVCKENVYVDNMSVPAVNVFTLVCRIIFLDDPDPGVIDDEKAQFTSVAKRYIPYPHYTVTGKIREYHSGITDILNTKPHIALAGQTQPIYVYNDEIHVVMGNNYRGLDPKQSDLIYKDIKARLLRKYPE
jgi:hypothetical protein